MPHVPYIPRPLGGTERLHDGNRELDGDVLSFWRWIASNLVSNATRGLLAEYIVAQAVGADLGVRDEWAPFDLTLPGDVTIEVKSSAYLQSWDQTTPSRPRFGVKPTQEWEPKSARFVGEHSRRARVYVFALLAHQDKATLDALNVQQWEFFVVPTSVLDNRSLTQESMALSVVRKLAGGSVRFEHLASAVRRAARQT